MHLKVADLERAARLGSPRAKENLDAARAFLQSLEGSGLSANVIEAQKAAKTQDWSKAITCLQDALREPSLKDNAELKSFLGDCYANRGIDACNQEQARLEAAQQKKKNPTTASKPRRNSRWAKPSWAQSRSKAT